MLPTFGDTATPDALRRLATVAEAGGYDALWAGDHITFPASIPNTYPFSPDGTPPRVFSPESNVYDVFTVLAHLAAITDTVTLGSNVCIVPYRHPVVLAKTLGTLDMIADNRLEFGVGVGWLDTEFDVLDVPFEERGSRTDEFLDLFTRICDDGTLAYDGPHHSFQETGFYPLPPDQPPIWIGGGSDTAFRRVGRHGDGWTTLWKRPDEIASARNRLLEYWRSNDRDGDPGIAVWRPIHIASDTDHDTSRPLIGDPTKVQADVAEYADAGVTRLVIDFYADTRSGQEEQLDRFADHVINSV